MSSTKGNKGLLKTNPMEHIAQRRVENKGPSSVMTFPKNIGAHGTLMRFFEYSYGGLKGSEEKRLAEIMLPLPKTIQDNLKVNVGGDELGITGAFTAQLASDPGDAARVADFVKMGAGNIAKMAGRLLGGKDVAKTVRSIAEGAGKTAEGVMDSSGFVTRAGLTKLSPDFANGLGKGRGTAVNPFASMVFKGVDLKVHSLEWLLSPESESEAKQLKKIIRTLQRMVLPKVQSAFGADADPTGIELIDRGIMRYPAMCNIYLMGVNESYFLRFKTSMISNLSVDYTPNGIALNKGGKPSAIRITMTLNEAFIHTAADHQPSDLLEEYLAEKVEDAITETLSDDEAPEYDATIVRTSTNQPPTPNQQRADDEVTITTTLPSGATQSKVVPKSQLKDQGFSDAQIAGQTPSGVEGVTFSSNGA